MSIDLPSTLNTQDDTGIRWTFIDEAPDPSKVRVGAWIVVGGTQSYGPTATSVVTSGTRSAPKP
jgi:hypothetical protein